MNKVILLGRLTATPSITWSQSGKPFLRASLAVSSYDKTNFINICAFGKTAEAMEKYLTKGSQINVVGSLDVTSYNHNKHKDVKMYSTSVLVESFYFTEKKKSEPATEQPTDDDGFMKADDMPDLPIE